MNGTAATAPPAAAVAFKSLRRVGSNWVMGRPSLDRNNLAIVVGGGTSAAARLQLPFD
jgi:hypothetical protein